MFFKKNQITLIGSTTGESKSKRRNFTQLVLPLGTASNSKLTFARRLSCSNCAIWTLVFFCDLNINHESFHLPASDEAKVGACIVDIFFETIQYSRTSIDAIQVEVILTKDSWLGSLCTCCNLYVTFSSSIFSSFSNFECTGCFIVSLTLHLMGRVSLFGGILSTFIFSLPLCIVQFMN